MKQNLDVFDFELTEDEMTRLKQLDENKSMWAEYDDPMIVQYAMSEETTFCLSDRSLCKEEILSNLIVTYKFTNIFKIISKWTNIAVSTVQNIISKKRRYMQC